MATVLYKENQQYRDKLTLAILGLFSLWAAFGAVQSLLSANGNYGKAALLLGIALAFAGLIWWLVHLKLKVTISDKNIKFKLSPIHSEKQTIAWEEVNECELVRTPAAAQWSGGNITYKHEKRISFNGRNGLALTTKSGESYFIGCRNIEALETVLKQVQLPAHG